MISRLTASAAIFAIAATATIAFAADARTKAVSQAGAVAAPTHVVVLPRIEVTGHRIAR